MVHLGTAWYQVHGRWAMGTILLLFYYFTTVQHGLVCTYIEVQQCTKYRMVLPVHFILDEWIYSVAWHGMVPSTEWSLWCIQGLYYSTEYQVWSYQVPSMLQLVLVKLIIIPSTACQHSTKYSIVASGGYAGWFI